MEGKSGKIQIKWTSGVEVITPFLYPSCPAKEYDAMRWSPVRTRVGPVFFFFFSSNYTIFSFMSSRAKEAVEISV